MMEDIKRPTNDESDEDLLKQQEVFFKNKIKPCVNLKKVIKSEDQQPELEDSMSANSKNVIQKSADLGIHQEKVDSDAQKIRPFCDESDKDLLKEQEMFMKNKTKSSEYLKTRQSEAKQPQNDLNPSECQNQIQEKSNLVVHAEELVFDVKERPLSSQPFVFQLPSVSSEEIFKALDKKSSLSQFAAKRKEQQGIASREQNGIKPVSSISGGTARGELDAIKKEVDKENQDIISNMSPEEIKRKVEQIKSQYDPELLKFLQNKRKCKSEASQNQSATFNSTPLEKPFKQYSTFDQEVPGEILREEGKAECDALILEKAFHPVSPRNVFEIETLKNKDIEIPETTKNIVNESNKGKWQNMNQIEKEKLEWISDLPKPNPVDLKTGYTARFDFLGKLLAYDVDIPVHEGLHHHGKEPEIAGYSFEELFLLARSSLQSQRITAFHTLAHILENYWCGMFDGCFDNPLLPTILDAGIVPLLRWALEDGTVTSVAATVTAVHSLLINKADEACLIKTFCWLNGSLIPNLEPTDLEEPNIVIEELTDADLIKLDVIKGFLRMDILPRFYYILQVLQPPPLVCKLIIEICSHLAQHSKQLSDQVVKHHPLMKLIFQKFLPLSWHFIDGSKLTDSANYCCPMSSAMKLMRILSSSCKDTAFYLLEKYELEKIVTLYLSLSPNDSKLTSIDAQNVIVETLKTLHVLLRYGYGFQVYLDLYPIFLRQMEFCLSLDLSANEKEHCQDFDYASHLFKMFEAVIIASAEESDCIHQENEVLIIFNQSLLCVKKWLYQAKQEKPSDRALTLLASALNFVSMYYKKSHKGLICDDWKPCSAVKDVYDKSLLPFLHSKVFKNLLDQIQSCSFLMSSYESGNKRDGKTLVSLGSVLWEGDVVPLLKEGSPVPLLLSIFNFILVHRNLSSDNDNQLFEYLYNNKVLKYLQKISSTKLNVGSWFVRYETHLVALLLQLMNSAAHHKTLELHKTAISLLPALKKPDECLIEDLFENIIFNEKCFRVSSTVSIQDIVAKLPVISKCYISYFLDEKSVFHSRNLHFGKIELDTMSSTNNPKCIIPHDWFYAPIFDLYRDSSKRKSNESLAPEDILLITSCLQWILLGRKMALTLLKSIPASEEFCYLAMVFLLDEDYFKDPRIKSILEANGIELLKERGIELTDLTCSNINSFDDFYLDLLNQFEAVSYGDHLFGNFILFPVQQCYPNKWRKILLTDHSHAILFLRVPLTKLLVPVKSYLEPCEMNVKILKEYLKLLLNGTLTHKRCPLLYLMAVHHLHHFIFMESVQDQKSQKLIIKNIAFSKNEILRRHLLLYYDVNIESPFGFSMKEKLTQSEEQHLSQIAGQSIKP